MRILVVEQDAALGLFLRKGFTGEGHDVVWTDGPEEATQLAGSWAPNLVILGVAEQQGMELLKVVHQLRPQAAMLTLVRGSAVEDRILCLDLGADDCMAKPFSFHELTARCRALLRREARSGEIVLAHGNLALNRISRSMSLAGMAVNLTAKEFRLLEYLLENLGRCCSRSELLTEVFQLPLENATNVVDVYINYLRKKLSFQADAPRIMTVRGAGYRLARTEQSDIHSAPMSVGALHASA